jgi:hypothetical protein
MCVSDTVFMHVCICLIFFQLYNDSDWLFVNLFSRFTLDLAGKSYQPDEVNTADIFLSLCSLSKHCIKS